jgi:FAD/FMN-containing dehydrogenase
MESIARGSSDYEAARRSAVWNARTPERFPEVIVKARSDEDVIVAVREASAAGRRVTVRSGGHSWAGHQLRDGVTLIDLSELNSIASVNREEMTAVVEPGCHGTDLVAELDKFDLFFPIGHCPGVGLGGFLLQGGFGWHSRELGPACMSVIGVDVVTADGELVRASADEHPDLYWAARGSGPGFFGVVLRFHLRVYPKPKLTVAATYLYPVELLDEVYSWMHAIGPDVAVQMEMQAVAHHSFDGNGLEVALLCPVFADSEEEARETLAILETCPVLDRAKAAVPYMPLTMEHFSAMVQANLPDDHRYGVDNMWTHAAASDLIPEIQKTVDAIPEAPSHLLWMNWAPSHPDTPARPDMAYSVEDEIYIAAYGVWTDASHDETNVQWATERMRAMESLASGIQLADENLDHRTARFMSDENYARYDKIRAAYDPDQLFCSWPSRP